jgi:hypothetical protein
MPLKNGEVSGTEANGELSTMYCELCYRDGKFLNPDMTIEEMKEVIDNTVGKEGLRGKFIAWMGKKQLPSLKRWKNS